MRIDSIKNFMAIIRCYLFALRKHLALPLAILVPFLWITTSTSTAQNLTGGQPAIRLKDNQEITFTKMVSEIRTSRVVFVGMDKNDRSQSKQVLDLLSTIFNASIPFVIALDTIPFDEGDTLERFVTGKITRDELLIFYANKSGQMVGALDSILDYAKEKRLLVTPIGSSKRAFDAINNVGFELIAKNEKELLPEGITLSIDDDFRERARPYIAGRNLTDAEREHRVESLFVKDKAGMIRLGKMLRDSPGITFVVVTDLISANKRSMPKHLSKIRQMPTRVILCEVKGSVDKDSVAVNDADYLMTK